MYVMALFDIIDREENPRQPMEGDIINNQGGIGMITCPNCGTEINEEAKFCRKCGTKITNGSYQWGPPLGSDNEEAEPMMPVRVEAKGEEIEKYDEQSQYGYDGESVIPPWDHTHEFDPEDISNNKITSMAGYVMGPIGIIIALIASQNSPFAGFHMRQALKFSILESIVGIVMILLCWTFIVPIAGSIFIIVLLVLRIIAFISLCKGKAVESPILRSIGFLK